MSVVNFYIETPAPSTEEEKSEERETQVVNMGHLPMMMHQHPLMKHEDFFLEQSSPFAQCSDATRAETQELESSLSCVFYEQDLKAISAAARFQPLPANSGSEVEDSVSVGISSYSSGSGNGLALAGCGPLAAYQEKVVSGAVTEEKPKTVSDTFGRRTSVYRGVTRLV